MRMWESYMGKLDDALECCCQNQPGVGVVGVDDVYMAEHELCSKLYEI